MAVDSLTAAKYEVAHVDWDITHGPLEQKMASRRDAGCQGYHSVEHHSGKHEYAEVAIQLALPRAWTPCRTLTRRGAST